MDFYRRMELVCQAIPYGQVTSYGQIALLCGRPRHARQVGYALSHHPFGPGLPAHRIVNSRRVLSGALSFGGPGIQRRLLLAEGVAFLPDGRVDLRRFGWRNSPEAFSDFEQLFAQQGV